MLLCVCVCLETRPGRGSRHGQSLCVCPETRPGAAVCGCVYLSRNSTGDRGRASLYDKCVCLSQNSDGGGLTAPALKAYNAALNQERVWALQAPARADAARGLYDRQGV